MIQDAAVARESKVSLREVKEESYRALRAIGYSWGQAQVAGRVAGVSQVLWGTGISAIVLDADRFMAARRSPRVTSSQSNVRINAKGTKFPTFAPLAFALALGKPNTEIFFKGAALTKEFATALWDIEEDSTDTFFWGSQTGGSSRHAVGYSVTDGELYQHGDPSSGSPKTWSLSRQAMPAGKLVLSLQARQEAVAQSLRSGVVVDPFEWSALKKLSWKFLVPE
jgi:hypothetical protein